MTPPGGPPRFADREAYAESLGNASFWAPYARAALTAVGVPPDDLEVGFPGTYPALLTGEVVVKLFGHFGDWRGAHAVEQAALRLLSADPPVSLSPRLLGSGVLFPGTPEPWPYLVVERIRGTAWRDADLSGAQAIAVAGRLGGWTRRLHERPVVPGKLPAGPSGTAADARQAAARHREWGSLPARLVSEVPGFLSGYRPSPVPGLVHGDLTEDHVFVERGRLTGVIDWGDALVADPAYDLGALHLGTFGGDRELLAVFLAGYRWPVDRGFPRHALQSALLHRFDLFGDVGEVSARASSLDDLATALWDPSAVR